MVARGRFRSGLLFITVTLRRSRSEPRRATAPLREPGRSSLEARLREHLGMTGREGCAQTNYGRQPSLLQPRQEARRIPPLAAELFDLGIELVDQRGDGEGGAVAAGFGDADREVLAHPFHGEAEIVLALVHGLVAVLHLPGLCRALGDGLDHGGDVEAALLGEMNALGEALHQACDADL